MDAPYTKRELDAKFSLIEEKLFDEKTGFLPRIERQTIKTNGRVTKHDKMLWVALGALSIITPLSFWVVNQVSDESKTISTIERLEIQAAVSSAISAALRENVESIEIIPHNN